MKRVLDDMGIWFVVIYVINVLSSSFICYIYLKKQKQYFFFVDNSAKEKYIQGLLISKKKFKHMLNWILAEINKVKIPSCLKVF